MDRSRRPHRSPARTPLEIEHGHNNKLSNDYSSTAYWYQFEPHKRFPKLPPAAKRLARPDWPPFEPDPQTPPAPPATATRSRQMRRTTR